jgi:hypothetical protein
MRPEAVSRVGALTLVTIAYANVVNFFDNIRLLHDYDTPSLHHRHLIQVIAGVSLFVALSGVGIAATLQTYKGRNAWRVTLIVFGWIATADAIFRGLLNFAEPHLAHGTLIGFLSLIWAALAATASIRLAQREVREWTAPPVSTPAGWYPTPDGLMRWWDGRAWTDQIQEPPSPTPPS